MCSSLFKFLRGWFTAEGGTRTHTPLREADFKSAASTIPPPRHLCYCCKLRMLNEKRRRADLNRRIGVLQTPALTSWLRRRTHQNSWSGRRDSNPRPLPWQGSILPLNYFRSELILASFFSSSKSCLVPRGRFELPRAFAHHPLKMACLPIPPPRPGRGGRIRTHDLRFWRPLLFHLSYTPANLDCSYLPLF